MEVIATDIPDVKIVIPVIHRDSRGYFAETYNEERYVKAGITARWRETGRNAPVKELFERFGFKLESFSESEKVYSKLLNL